MPAVYDRCHMPAWLVWCLLAVLLAIGEIVTPGLFFLGPIALAAAASAIAAAVGAGWVIELVVFVVGAVASLGVLRPIARRHLRVPHAIRTGTAALVGAKAAVVERVDANGGRVKIGGEVWSARAFDESQVFEPGSAGRGRRNRGRDGARLRIGGPMVPLIVIVVVVVLVLAVLARTIRIVPQARAGVIERLGRYSRHAFAGARDRRAVRRPPPAADRPARAGRLVRSRSR